MIFMRYLLLTLFGCLALAAARAERPEKAGTARLLLEYASHDFGDVPRKGSTLVHEFGFTNGGEVPLVITRVVTSCSCLKASYAKRPVAPGGKGYIRIAYEPRKSEPGTFHKVIQIYSNSAGGRDIVTVQGNSTDERPPRGR